MCDTCDWKESVATIKELLDSGDYDWASDTLESTLEWVEANQHVTARQKQAVQHIAERGGR